LKRGKGNHREKKGSIPIDQIGGRKRKKNRAHLGRGLPVPFVKITEREKKWPSLGEERILAPGREPFRSAGSPRNWEKEGLYIVSPNRSEKKRKEKKMVRTKEVLGRGNRQGQEKKKKEDTVPTSPPREKKGDHY